MYPPELLYTKDHEWIRVDESIGTIGITDHAQSELGDIVFVELPKVGQKLTQMQPFGSVEAVKAVSDLFCPVKAEVIEVNAALDDEPAVVNSDPYGDGWMIKIRVQEPGDLGELMDATAYTDHVGG